MVKPTEAFRITVAVVGMMYARRRPGRCGRGARRPTFTSSQTAHGGQKSTILALYTTLNLVGFQNRLIVLIRWFISFATRGRGARLITSTPATESAFRPETHGMKTTKPITPPQAPSDDREVVGQ